MRIVAQLRGRFAAWRVESDCGDEPCTSRASSTRSSSGPTLSPPLRRERVVALIMVLTATTAERARRIDEGSVPELDHEAFVGNLVDMCSAVVLAPHTD